MEVGLKHQLMLEGARVRLIQVTKEANAMRELLGLDELPLDDITPRRGKKGGKNGADLAIEKNRKPRKKGGGSPHMRKMWDARRALGMTGPMKKSESKKIREYLEKQEA